MLVKYWKNFKWFLFIPLIVFVFVFKISNVNALIYKDSVYSTYTINGNTSGTLSNGQQTKISYILNNPNFNLDYDYLVFKFGSLSMRTDDNLTFSGLVGNNGGIQTTHCSQAGTSYNCNASQVVNTQTTNLYTTNGINEGIFYMSASLHYLIDNVDYYVPCTLESGLDYQWYCPFNKTFNQPYSFDFEIKNGGFDSFTYSVTLNGFKYYYNNESTEITIQQQTTNTNLQYIYQQQQDNQQYLENDSTSGASTQATGDFTELAQDFNEQLSGVNDLTQLVLLPISLFMDLSTDNCQPLHLQIPYVNMSVDLPCMKAVFNQYFNGLYSIFTTIMSAVICYWVAVKTGALVKEILDCDNDRIEVVDL